MQPVVGDPFSRPQRGRIRQPGVKRRDNVKTIPHPTLKGSKSLSVFVRDWHPFRVRFLFLSLTQGGATLALGYRIAALQAAGCILYVANYVNMLKFISVY